MFHTFSQLIIFCWGCGTGATLSIFGAWAIIRALTPRRTAPATPQRRITRRLP